MYEIVEYNNHPTVPQSNTRIKQSQKIELILFRQVLFNFKCAKLNSQIIC